MSRKFLYEHGIHKTIVLLLDGLGVGSMPDSLTFHDDLSSTLSQISEYSPNQISIPKLVSLGLSNLTFIKNWLRLEHTQGFYGKIKQYTNSTLPIAGYTQLFGSYRYHHNLTLSNSLNEFPEDLIYKIEKTTELTFIGKEKNTTYNILQKYGNEHIDTKYPLIYLMDDHSVNIAVEITENFDINQLYLLCEKIVILCEKYNIDKVIARPLKIEQGILLPILGSKIFGHSLEEANLLVALSEKNIETHSIGSIAQMIGVNWFTSHYESLNIAEVIKHLSILMHQRDTERLKSVLFVDLINDFYHKYGFQEHSKKREDSYIHYLQDIDKTISSIIKIMHAEDVLFILSPFAANPLAKKSYYTREYLPLLVYSKSFNPYDVGNLGLRDGLGDIAHTIAEIYSVDLLHINGHSFWEQISSQI